jgi:predicted dinucleotide-binding enzyme
MGLTKREQAKLDVKAAVDAPTAAAVAVAAGFTLVPRIKCTTPVNCGNTETNHLIHTGTSLAADLAVKPCTRCGARGTWVPY